MTLGIEDVVDCVGVEPQPSVILNKEITNITPNIFFFNLFTVELMSFILYKSLEKLKDNYLIIYFIIYSYPLSLIFLAVL